MFLVVRSLGFDKDVVASCRDKKEMQEIKSFRDLSNDMLKVTVDQETTYALLIDSKLNNAQP